MDELVYEPANRRFGRRVNFRGAVQVYLSENSEPQGSVGYDLSENGIRLNLGDFIPVNKEVTLKVQLADEKTVDCVGRVVWMTKSPFSDRYQAGLTLTPEDPNVISKVELKHFVRNQAVKGVS